MPRARRVALWLGASVAALLLLALVAVGVVIHNDAAARRIVAWMVDRSGGNLRVGAVHGDLGGPLVLEHVRFRSPAWSATADSVFLDWSPRALLGREVHVNRLHVRGVEIVLPDSAPRDTAPPERPRLPMPVRLGEVVVRDVAVRAPGGVELRGGRARLAGWAENYRIEAGGTARLPRLDSVPFTLAGAGNLEQLRLDRSLVSLLEGGVRASGVVAWWPAPAWELTVAADRIRLALLLPQPDEWPGRIDARLSTLGRIDSTGPHGRLVVDTVTGTLRRQPLAGAGDVRFAGTALEIPVLAVAWGSARLRTDGSVADSLRLRYALTVENLGTMLPRARGTLRAEGTVGGSRAAPVATAELDASGLTYGAVTVARLAGGMRVGIAPDAPAEISLAAAGLRAGARRLDSMTLEVDGTRSHHRLALAGAAGETRLALGATGGLPERSWRGVVDTIRVLSPDAGTWRLRAPAGLAAGPDLVALDTLCLVADSSNACLAARMRDARNWRVAARLDRLPFGTVTALLPPSLPEGQAVTGSLRATLDARADAGRIAGELRADASDAAFRYRLPTDTAPEQLRFDSAAVRATAGREGLRAELAMAFVAADGAPAGRLDGRLALPRYHTMGRPIASEPLEARLEGRLEELALVRAWAASLDSITGAVRFALAVDGTAGAPDLVGEMHADSIDAWLRNGRAGHGSADLELAGRIGAGRMAGRLRIVPRGVIYRYAFAGLPRAIAVDSGAFELHAADSGLTARLGLGVSEPGRGTLGMVSGRLRLPDYRSPDQPIGPAPFTASLDLEVADLGLFQATTAAFDSLEGRLRLAAEASGTVEAPTVGAELDVSGLRARMPQGGTLAGGLDGSLDAVVRADGTARGELRLAPRELTLSFPAGDTVRQAAVAGDGLTAALGPGGFRSALSLLFRDPGEIATLSGRLALPDYAGPGDSLAAQPLDAELTARVPDLALADALTDLIEDAEGRLDLALRADGTVGEPRVRGALDLASPSARLPLLGVTWRDIRLTARSDAAGEFTLRGGAVSGGGRIVLEGRSPLVPSAERPGRLRIRGERFEAADASTLRAVVSPDLRLTLSRRRIDVAGSVELPVLRIELDEIPVTAVPPSDDVVFVADSAADTTLARRLFAGQVEVVLGDSVSFAGFNARAELDGRLMVTLRPEQPPVASGDLVITEGRYLAYGQDLTVRRGTVRFANSVLMNPELDLRAERVADDGVVAGVLVQGTLEAPSVTIFSEPAMPQGRALAYIMLGHAPGEAGQVGGQLLSRAATSVGLRGANVLAASFGRSLGLSDASIESEGDVQESEFVAGKYLTPDLYVSYGVGLFEPVNTLRLRYRLSDRWALRAERGSAARADLLFTTDPEP